MAPVAMKAVAPALPCCSKAAAVHAITPTFSRRALFASTVAGILGSAEVASAWDGPAKFLKSRQLANSEKLIAPFIVSVTRLEEAERYVSEENFDNALAMVRRASCNCYTFEALPTDSFDTRASLITQNLKIADPCTFRIIVKNTTLLMDYDDPLKVQSYDTLDFVIRAFTKLDSALVQAGEWDSETRDQVLPLLQLTMQGVDTLKDLVARCILQEV